MYTDIMCIVFREFHYLYRDNLCMHPANERRRWNVTSSLTGWAHTENDPWKLYGCCSRVQDTLHWHHIEFEAKWLLFCRRNFQMHFLESFLIYILTQISLMFLPYGPINNRPALVQIMAWDCRRRGNEPTPSWNSDGIGHWRIYASPGLNDLSKRKHARRLK